MKKSSFASRVQPSLIEEARRIAKAEGVASRPGTPAQAEPRLNRSDTSIHSAINMAQWSHANDR